jgi:hypothetical protein
MRFTTANKEGNGRPGGPEETLKLEEFPAGKRRQPKRRNNELSAFRFRPDA